MQVLKFELYDIFNGPIKINKHHTRKTMSILLNIHGCLLLSIEYPIFKAIVEQKYYSGLYSNFMIRLFLYFVQRNVICNKEWSIDILVQRKVLAPRVSYIYIGSGHFMGD